MTTKKKRRTKASQAKKKKRVIKTVFLSLILTVAVAFLIFFFVSLFDYVYPPITGEGVTAQKREKIKVQLYFSDANERFLTPEIRYINKMKTTNDQLKELVEALVGGPSTDLVRTFPEGVTVQSVSLKKDGTALVSFDKNLVALHPGGSTSEVTTIYSLTNTLSLNIPQVKSVKLLVNGKELQTIKGHIDTRYPFTLNRDLLAKRS